MSVHVTLAIVLAVLLCGPLHTDAGGFEPGCCPVNESLLWKKTFKNLGPEFNIIGPLYNYSFLVPHLELREGLSYYGSAIRLRSFVDKLLKGTKPLTVGIVGGSISFGHHADVIGRDDWFSLVMTWMASIAKQPVSFRNGCVPGTPSAYMVLCMQYFLDPDVDLVFVEYTMNDRVQNDDVTRNSVIMAMERLYRRILKLPNRPAVISMQVPLAWDVYTETSEFLEGALSSYYDIPTVSLHTVLSHLLYQYPHPGFDYDHLYTRKHPANAGHKMMADLAVHLLQETAFDIVRHPIEREREHLEQRLCAPMHRGNEPPANTSCALGPDLQGLVLKSHGWEWVNEGTKVSPKWGLVAMQPGDAMVLRFNTRRPMVGREPISMYLYFLASYTGMGMAELKCVFGCTCEPAIVDANIADHVSQSYMEQLTVSQSPICDLQVTVVNQTNSGGNKFKVTGLVVTETTPNSELISTKQWTMSNYFIPKDGSA